MTKLTLKKKERPSGLRKLFEDRVADMCAAANNLVKAALAASKAVRARTGLVAQAVKSAGDR